MKNVKKLLKKAMVFTVAASMLVGTPLTASAAGIRGVYSVSDGTDENGNDSGTGTVTNTNTSTGSGVLNNNDAKIIGIVLDKNTVNAEKGQKETLTATIVLDDDNLSVEEKDEIRSQLEKKIRWDLSCVDDPDKKLRNPAEYVSITGSSADRTKVTLNPRKGTKKGEEVVVTASIQSSYYLIKNEETGEYEIKEYANKHDSYAASAVVSVKEYSTALAFENPMPKAYVKHTLDLNDYIVRTPSSANDTITWISSDTKVASVTAAGVVTFKKAGETDIIAVGEKGAKAVWSVEVETGVQSSRIEILNDDTDAPFVNGNNQTKKADVDIADDNDWQQDARVVMYAKVKAALNKDGELAANEAEAEDAKAANGNYKSKTVEVKDGDPYIEVSKDNKSITVKDDWAITDTITWTSNKPAIVSVDGDNDTAVLYANGVGTAVVTAKASSGKTDKVTVAVKATLQGLFITNTEGELYSGQTLQMTYERDPEQNKDAVKWSIAKVEVGDKLVANPNASINAKGILTIKPKLNLSDEAYRTVTVVLESKTTKTITDAEGKTVKVPLGKDEYEIPISQSSIDGIVVTDDQGVEVAEVATTYNSNGVGKVAQVKKENNTTLISVPKNRTYTATVTPSAGLDYEAGADTLTWKTSNAKIASVEPAADGTAKITAVGKGTATITVSGIRAVDNVDGEGNHTLKSASVIKTTFKVSVKQPVTTVTLNKPSVVLNEKTKKVSGETVLADQKVALKATLGPKGVKSEAVHWSVKQTAGTDHSAALADLKTLGLLDKNGNEVTKASISVNLPTPAVGDVFEITARTDSGAYATSTVQIVNKAVGVAIASEPLSDDGTPVLFTTTNNAGKVVNNTKEAVIGDSFQMYPCINIGATTRPENAWWVTAGTNNAETVTYSVSKKGIVNIDSDGNVHVINSGTVTITAKTPLNKKATLKVTVAKP